MEDIFENRTTRVGTPFYKRPATFAWAIILLMGLLLTFTLVLM